MSGGAARLSGDPSILEVPVLWGDPQRQRATAEWNRPEPSVLDGGAGLNLGEKLNAFRMVGPPQPFGTFTPCACVLLFPVSEGSV